MKRLRWFGLALSLAGIVVLLLSVLPGGASGGSGNAKYRWDIINLDFATLTISAGGHASAFATGSGGTTHAGQITLTGHGTFRSNSGNAQNVTGGGTWQTFDGSGNPIANGNYRVTGFVSFHLASGFLPAGFTDTIADKADAHSGLVVLKIAYDDGSDGVLVVSCDLPGGLHPDIFEGITASKGFVSYWERDPAVGGVNANRTEFHQIH
jgi:hypothetical protein